MMSYPLVCSACGGHVTVTFGKLTPAGDPMGLLYRSSGDKMECDDCGTVFNSIISFNDGIFYAVNDV